MDKNKQYFKMGLGTLMVGTALITGGICATDSPTVYGATQSKVITTKTVVNLKKQLKQKQAKLAKATTKATKVKLRKQISTLKKRIQAASKVKTTTSKTTKAKKQQKPVAQSQASSQASSTVASASVQATSSAQASASVESSASSQATPQQPDYGFQFVNSDSISPQATFTPDNPDNLKVGDGAILLSDNNLAIYNSLPSSDQPDASTAISNPKVYNGTLMLIDDIETNQAGITYAKVTSVADPNNKTVVGWVIMSQLRVAISDAQDLMRAPQNTDASSIDDVKSGALAALNAIRAKNGLSTLSEDSLLTTIAKTRSQDIVTDFSHDDAQGNSIAEKYLTAAGIYGGAAEYDRYGENLSADLNTRDFSYYMIGYQSVYSMTYADASDSNWGHRENILNPNFTNIGIGVTYDSNKNCFYIAYEFTGVN
ncbi:CAP domain-containing protein (plasmid) [Nicoliella spurrieriana]|uniref:CAP domain-containing protein n=1 Tax=Nicoliella spurrieriana TaxID=2925830 RepID=A0A976RQP4_9LACO|nr:CAP domain-containing protein [Nicoliella spurrieriana]UQS86142.1 CAP domain-containing protein [Nicoliella spurrieriana]